MQKKMEIRRIKMTKAVAVACDMVTPYGWGIDPCWKGLMSGITAIRRIDRFSTVNLHTENAAMVPGLKAVKNKSLIMQMLTPLLSKIVPGIPEETFVILATTTGEIEILERFVLNKKSEAKKSLPGNLLDKIITLSGTDGKGMVISAACASSSAALSKAASMIRNRELDSVLMVACDCVSEFVTAGFSSLMALDRDKAKPFDKNRQGLSLGEAAGYMLLMSDERADREHRSVIGEIAGWGLTNDANHITGPSKDGIGLSMAILNALESAGVSENEIGSISAHGTGTIYNDSMEMRAIKKIFGQRPVPVYSVKGGTGHTLGAAGLLETIISFCSLDKKVVPPTVNLRDIDREAEGWVSSGQQSFESPVTLSTNSGFGGVNSALVLKKALKKSEEIL
jgi:3-oxoacyl-[acyl-carrier-protein] synthase II